MPADSLGRVVIEDVRPEIDAGRFPVKRCLGDAVRVRAAAFADSADVVSAALLHRPAGRKDWSQTPMARASAGLDEWEGEFLVDSPGRYEYAVRAWIDRFATWRRDLQKKVEAGQPVDSDLLEGARLVRGAAGRAEGADQDWLRRRVDTLSDASDAAGRVPAALEPELLCRMAKVPDLDQAATSRVLPVTVERNRARTGAWYEMFPRSAASAPPERGATFRQAEERLLEIGRMGFDVLYLPPIHPIGESFRKGPNNRTPAAPGDPGSPWAIGSAAGGHKAVHPDLGTLEDFDRFVKAARLAGLEIALDLAFQCSPDHPYVREHPEWFRHRPDGSIKYAENPPKKYEDIYPLDFECADWQALWQEGLEVTLFWVKRGVSIFRVDNPHTKPFRFWEWLIRHTQERHPNVVFLAEAFTRPRVMRQLAKAGFSQSYTYFTWRTTKDELQDYLTELTQPPVSDYLRPNLFANTPDILHDYLQRGGRPAFQIRLILAATLSASYGIYGPAFELCEARAFPGTEDYIDSEKYQIRRWDLDRPGNIRDLITRVNGIRRDNPALHFNTNLRFYPSDDPNILFYGKATADGANRILVAVNLDPHQEHYGWVQAPQAAWGLGPRYTVDDLLSGQSFTWEGERNFVKLNPQQAPAHILRVRRA